LRRPDSLQLQLALLHCSAACLSVDGFIYYYCCQRMVPVLLLLTPCVVSVLSVVASALLARWQREFHEWYGLSLSC
jgi:hypothetical protein